MLNPLKALGRWMRRRTRRLDSRYLWEMARENALATEHSDLTPFEMFMLVATFHIAHDPVWADQDEWLGQPEDPVVWWNAHQVKS